MIHTDLFELHIPNTLHYENNTSVHMYILKVFLSYTETII